MFRGSGEQAVIWRLKSQPLILVYVWRVHFTQFPKLKRAGSLFSHKTSITRLTWRH